MDLNTVRMFITVAQVGSLSAAVDKLAIPLPTLSRRLAELENSLNVQLMERSKRGIRLTTAGQRLFDQALYSIESLLEAERAVKSDMQSLHGTLRISLPPNFEFCSDLIIAFQREYPNIDVVCHYTDAILDLIYDGIDVALRVGELYTDKVIAKKCLPIKHILAASPTFLEQHDLPMLPERLLSFPLAGWYFSRGTLTTWRFKQGQKEYNITPRFKFSVNNFNVLCDYALKAMAICELPYFIAKPYLKTGELVQILPEFSLPILPVHLIYTSHRHPSSIVRTYLEFCEGWLNNYLG